MASLKEITALCKDGQTQKAYELSKTDMEQQLPWAQREMGWTLYYLMKDDTDKNDYTSLEAHLEEFSTLDQLSMTDDGMIFENVLYKVAGYVKDHVSPKDLNSPARLSSLFSKLRGFTFEASKGYSFLLQSFIRCDGWQEMADFIDWWNLNNLTQEDYTPFKTDAGKSIMSIAEQAFIAKSKALLRLNDLERIKAFLPQMDDLMEKHPEMTYPGYFYGKLLLSLGSDTDEALKVVVPFAKKKSSEFWVWQLLSDVFTNDQEKQLACLLRAVNSSTKENFLGKVRIKLAALYVQRNQYDYARYQIDKITQCYQSQGWHLPYEVECWIHQSWINSVTPNSGTPIDYMAITKAILCKDSKKVEGKVRKRDDKDFAFLKTKEGDYFISPNVVRKYGLQDGEVVKGLIVYDYNKKKETWGWTCISINK